MRIIIIPIRFHKLSMLFFKRSFENENIVGTVLLKRMRIMRLILATNENNNYSNS